jgi:hypothetical protein
MMQSPLIMGFASFKSGIICFNLLVLKFIELNLYKLQQLHFYKNQSLLRSSQICFLKWHGSLRGALISLKL